MRNRRLTIWALWGLLIMGCNKSELISENASSVDNGGLISFSLSTQDEVDWTKGTETNDISDVDALQVYSYATTSAWEDAEITPYFTDNLLTPFTLTQNNGSWTYNIGSQYWPADGRYLSFFAYYPEGMLSASIDDDDRPVYSYTLNSLSRYNDDLLVNATYDLTRESNGDSDLVNLELKHALTKITLQAKLKGDLNPDGLAYSADCDSYAINGIAFYDIYDNAVLVIDEDGTVSWEVDPSSSIELSSTQGQTLLDVTDDDAILNNVSYKSVMLDGEAIFVLPQSLSAVREAEGGTAPRAMVRVRRTFNANIGTEDVPVKDESTTEIIYESAITTIPAPTVAEISGGTGSGCWDAGQHVRYSFEFDISQLEVYQTPLTITSEVLDWTEATVTADIHSNLYVYSSLNTVAVDTEDNGNSYFGDFQICTNYDYNLRVPHHRVELGGTITSSRGFLFCSDDFNEDGYFGTNANNTNHVTTYTSSGKTYKAFVPTLLSVDSDGTQNEIIYADKYNLNAALSGDDVVYDSDGKATYTDGSATDIIYEYPGANGYNDTGSRAAIAGVTKADIVYGSNGYAYLLNSSTGLYRLLYLDPRTHTDGGTGAVTAFNYVNNDETGYHEIKLTNFASDDENTVSFKVNIGDINGDGSDYTFDFWVTRSTRSEEGLYVSTAIADNSSYGVNKQGDDAVYTLRLSVEPSHLLKYDEDSSSWSYGSFDDIIGVEMISNGGGMITTLFPVTLEDSNDKIVTSAEDLATSLGLNDSNVE